VCVGLVGEASCMQSRVCMTVIPPHAPVRGIFTTVTSSPCEDQPQPRRAALNALPRVARKRRTRKRRTLRLSPLEGCEVLRLACMHVCLSVRLLILHLKSRAQTSPNFPRILPVAQCHLTTMLLCSTLWTSGFVDYVMFSRNGNS